MPLTIDPKTTALVLIDLQKGILARAPAPHSSAQIVQHSAALGQKCAALNIPIFPVHVTFSADGGDRLQQPIDEPMQLPPGGLPKDFAEFVPEIAALPAAAIITKHNWGAFHGTQLDLQLRRRGITTIILSGIATNIGVEQTAREAWQHNYAVVLAEDATTSFTAEMHEFSIKKIMPRLALVRSTAEILAALD
jgi:nicotinamidase-related amidase